MSIESDLKSLTKAIEALTQAITANQAQPEPAQEPKPAKVTKPTPKPEPAPEEPVETPSQATTDHPSLDDVKDIARKAITGGATRTSVKKLVIKAGAGSLAELDEEGRSSFVALVAKLQTP